MIDNWIEIVETLQPYIVGNSIESRYQQEIEYCLKMLGWRQSNGTMQSQVSLNIGHRNTIRPDIVLYKNDLPVLPIEIKRPSNSCNGQQEQQLMSYMRQLRLNVGLYIGENIQLFYDNPADIDNPISILKVELNKEDANGVTICELLSYPRFDSAVLESYCKDRYNEIISSMNLQQALSQFLSPATAEDNIKALLKSKFVHEDYPNHLIEDELRKLHISIGYSSVVCEQSQVQQHYNHTNDIHTPAVSVRRPNAESHSTRSRLVVKFFDGTMIEAGKAIHVERDFILKVGIDKVKSLRMKHCGEDLVGDPRYTKKPDKYADRWTLIQGNEYLFNCSSTGDKVKHINHIIRQLNLNATVELI